METDNKRYEVIAKFSGDISAIAKENEAEIEILTQGYAIITIEKDRISSLYSYPQIESFELPKTIYIAGGSLASSCVDTVQDGKMYSLDGRGVIVGIIDSGIDFTLADFRNPDGSSRILYLWDQSAAGIPPEGFVGGAQYTKEDIDRALLSEKPFETVRSRDFLGHGTAVAGIAAGGVSGEASGVAPKSPLIIVKIGSRGEGSFAKTTELMRALKYVIGKARELNMPVAINMSFGMNNGSHRGDSLFETYISQVSMEWKVSISVPTGNEGAAGHHYAGQIQSFKTREVEFFTASGIEEFYISMWKNFADSFAVELIFPGGASSGVIGVEGQIKTVREGNLLLTVIYGQPDRYSVRQELFFNVRAQEGVISSGVWKVRIISSAVVDGGFEMWLPTIEAVTAQTYFSSPTVSDTMTIPSTAQKVIRVAGYNEALGNVAEFSGQGSLNPALPNPDIAAPCVGIMAPLAGGGYDAFTGTSFASPFVCGAAALMMQWGIAEKRDPFLYGERIKAFLRLGAQRSAGVSYPNRTSGYGKLCLADTVSFLERYEWGGFNLWLQI